MEKILLGVLLTNLGMQNGQQLVVVTSTRNVVERSIVQYYPTEKSCEDARDIHTNNWLAAHGGYSGVNTFDGILALCWPVTIPRTSMMRPHR